MFVALALSTLRCYALHHGYSFHLIHSIDEDTKEDRKCQQVDVRHSFGLDGELLILLPFENSRKSEFSPVHVPASLSVPLEARRDGRGLAVLCGRRRRRH